MVVGALPSLCLCLEKAGCVHVSTLLVVHADGFFSHPLNYQIVF